MQNAMLKKGLIIVGMLTVTASIVSCAKDGDKETNSVNAAGSSDYEESLVGEDGIGEAAVDNESGIVNFSYSLNGFMGDSYSYDITKTDENILLTYEGMEERDYGTIEAEVSQDVMDRLEEIYKSYRVAEWDGYSKYDPNVLDGSGFSLLIRFADGGKVMASGENAFPKNFDKFEKDMLALLEPLKEKSKEEKRQEVIKNGINGELNSILASFIQHGYSGRDEYHILITSSEERDSNFEVYIKSSSGEFFPEGEYRCHRSVPDEVLNLQKVQEIIEKYNMIEWYDYSETAKDYQNKEWYQVEFGFDDDFSLSSMGTVYPKNYEKFRKEFLTWLKATADVVDTLPEE